MSSKPKEILSGALLQGPLRSKTTAGAQQFAGKATISSGSATVTVSTAVVKSDSLIMNGVRALTDQASGSGCGVEVRTVIDSTSFVLANSDSSVRAFDVSVDWMIVQIK